MLRLQVVMRKATAYKGMPTAQVRSQLHGITPIAISVAIGGVRLGLFRCYSAFVATRSGTLQQLCLCLQEVFNGSHDKIATLFTAIIRAFVLRDARLHPPVPTRPHAPARMPPPARTPSAIADAPLGDVRWMGPAR